MHIQGVSAFRFSTPEQRVKVVDFDVCQNAMKLIGYHSNFPFDKQKLCQFCNPHTCDYLCWKADEDRPSSSWYIRLDMPISPSCPKRCSCYPHRLTISWVTGLNFTKVVHNHSREILQLRLVDKTMKTVINETNCIFTEINGNLRIGLFRGIAFHASARFIHAIRPRSFTENVTESWTICKCTLSCSIECKRCTRS